MKKKIGLRWALHVTDAVKVAGIVALLLVAKMALAVLFARYNRRRLERSLPR